MIGRGVSVGLVWITFPAAEILTCLIAVWFMKRVNAKKIRVLDIF